MDSRSIVYSTSLSADLSNHYNKANERCERRSLANKHTWGGVGVCIGVPTASYLEMFATLFLTLSTDSMKLPRIDVVAASIKNKKGRVIYPNYCEIGEKDHNWRSLD